jgi:signal transduction histidine kinase
LTTPSKESPATAGGDAFLPQLAHDLRNRLAPMRNALHLLRKRVGDDEQGQWAVAMMDRQIDHLNDAIAALDDLAKIARGTARIRNVAFDLAAVVTAAMDAAAASLEARRQTLDRPPPSTTLTVHGDRERLEQSLRAVILAVAKHAASGARIEVRCVSSERGIEVAIHPAHSSGAAPADSGGGMSADPNTLGVQVTLAQRVIELHGGSLVSTFDAGGALLVLIRLRSPATPA